MIALPLLLIATLPYFVYNKYVQQKIEQAVYLDERRRTLHKKIIWILPFIGPQLIKSFWSPKKKPLEIKTKDNRNVELSGFHESGAGIY